MLISYFHHHVISISIVSFVYIIYINKYDATACVFIIVTGYPYFILLVARKRGKDRERERERENDRTLKVVLR